MALPLPNLLGGQDTVPCILVVRESRQGTPILVSDLLLFPVNHVVKDDAPATLPSPIVRSQDGPHQFDGTGGWLLRTKDRDDKLE